MNKIKKLIEFLAFALFSITALVFISLKFWTPLAANDYAVILIFLFLLVFVDSFPIKVGEIYVTFILAISITVFLEYGIVVEAWLTQISILISMLISGQRRAISRIFLNQMMFIWVSLTSGFVFLLAGGTIGFTVNNVGNQMIPIMLYTAVNFLSNHIILYFIFNRIEQRKLKLLSEDLIWDAATLLLTLPLGVIMYLVKISYGNYGMLFVAIPIIIITQLFRIYNDLHHSHNQLQVLNRISASFTSELNLEKTVSSLQEAIRELLPFDYSYIMLVNGDKLKLISVEDFTGNKVEKEEYENFNLSLGEGLSGHVALYKKAKLVSSDADIFQLDHEPDYIKDNKSLLSVPMIWHNQIIGVITLGSSVEYHFSKKDLTIVKIIASQAAIAIQNATKYQKTEERSLMDELTGVYNFRAFDVMLQDMVLEAEMKEEKLSLLMIDLDYFKQVNDRYGHSAGNIVLKEVAKVLKEQTRREDVIARYGGEEFTIIIPNTDCQKANTIAERIRDAIENHPVKIRDNLNDNKDIKIYVTASIGVAAYPHMASSGQELIRHADRAMYIGSKQAGRNRVSVYQLA